MFIRNEIQLRSCSVWLQGSMRNIFEIKLPLDQIIWNGCRSLLKISRGNWSRNYTKKNSNSSMLPWETIISPNNFPAQSIVFPKQEAVNFLFFFLFFSFHFRFQHRVKILRPSSMHHRWWNFYLAFNLASCVCIKVS